MTNTETQSESCMAQTIPAYIGLLCAGERVLSKRLLQTAIDLAGALGEDAAGTDQDGHSHDRCGCGGGGTGRGRAPACSGEPDGEGELLLRRDRALQALLASLLVLRVSPYWRRVPELEKLFAWCISASARLEAAERRYRARVADHSDTGD